MKSSSWKDKILADSSTEIPGAEHFPGLSFLCYLLFNISCWYGAAGFLLFSDGTASTWTISDSKFGLGRLLVEPSLSNPASIESPGLAFELRRMDRV